MALQIDTIRQFIQDYQQNNYLLNEQEFTDSDIQLSMNLAVDMFNSIPPRSVTYQVSTFPSDAILMYGTLGFMFEGRAALLARNHLEYTDGGLTVPVEERAQLYLSLAATYKQQFQTYSEQYKINSNLESGWGSVSSDMAAFPSW
jgi:hypothetical protein